MTTTTINNSKVSLTDPIVLLNTWRNLDDMHKLELKDAYFNYWTKDDEYIDDLFTNRTRKTKESHWQYWWKTIDLLSDRLTRQTWLDKWYHALDNARIKREIGIERELLENVSLWVWPEDRELFYCEITNLLVSDYKMTNSYKNGDSPFYFFIQYPGVGASVQTWQSTVQKLINYTYPEPTSLQGLKNKAKLWVLVSLFDYSKELGNSMLPIPNILIFQQNPNIWNKLLEPGTTVTDVWKLIDSIDKLV